MTTSVHAQIAGLLLQGLRSYRSLGLEIPLAKAKVPVVESVVVGNRACSHLAMNHERARMAIAGTGRGGG